MKELLTFLLFCICFGCIAFVVSKYPGSIHVSWLGYELTASVTIVFWFLTTLFIVFYVLRWPILFVRWIRSFLLSKKERKKEVLLQQILKAIAIHDIQNKITIVTKINQLFSSNSSTNLLLKALFIPSESIYRALTEKADTELVGWLGLIQQYKNNGDIVDALALCEKACLKYKKVPQLLQNTLQLQIMDSKWKEALKTLELLDKINFLDEHVYSTQKAILLSELGSLYKAFKEAPWISKIAISATQEKPHKAESILIKAWEAAPSFSIYEAYQKLHEKDNPLAFHKKIEKMVHKNALRTRVGYLVLADSSYRAKLWGQMKKELDDYLRAFSLTPPVALMMASYEQVARQNMKVAQEWTEKAKTLDPSFLYSCSKCAHMTNTWNAICPTCNSFASFEVCSCI